MEFEESTVLVGSGVSVLDHELGETIDSFGEVVRFNGFDEAPERFEEYAGAHVDSVVTNTNWNTAKRLKNKLRAETFRELGAEQFYVTWTRKRSLRRSYKAFKNLVFNDTIVNYTRVQRHAKRFAYDADITEYEPDNDLSSGLIMALHKVFEEKDRPLYLHGFDAMEKPEVPAKHYYEDEKININRIHNLQNEAVMLNGLVEAGYAKKLTEHV
jgi:hypothetical protein